jgi:signal transduction histidine kinase
VLSLLWSFVQCKTLATHQIQRLARDRLDSLLQDLRREATHRQLDPGDVVTLLGRLTQQSGIGNECLVYYLPDGAPAPLVVGHPANMRPPRLPAYPLSILRQRQIGGLDIPQLRLTGQHERLSDPLFGPRLGSVAVLYPDYLHPGFSGSGESPLRGQLLALVFFFLVLMFVSGGVVVIAAVDLSRPVRYLERRAAAMAGGELNLPVVQTAVETDEVGRLTFAFEEMRRALSEKLRSSTQLNLRLEAEVKRRTAELSRRNEEVSEALSKLQLTRDELLRTEKLATMGRIAAGVTSEINNPVNVMSTIPDPISDELDELVRLAERRPLPRAQVGATLAELQKMVDVLLRGAQRAKEIVRATRVYVRTGDDRAGPLDPNQVLDEVLQLFADMPRYGVGVVRDYGEGLRVAAARSDLAQILSSYLARITPRLRDVHRASPLVTLTVRTRRRPEGHGAADKVEVVITDDGPLLAAGELGAFAEGDLLGRLHGRAEAHSQATPTGNQTMLSLLLEQGTI